MKMGALIKSNLHENPDGMSMERFAEAYAQAIWIERFRMDNTAQMIASMFGAKQK